MKNWGLASLSTAESTWVTAIVIWGVFSCGGNGQGASRSRGGALGSGGAQATGGLLAKGGTPAPGGTSTTGGTPAAGGTISVGGTPSQGGSQPSGGTSAMGGASPAGGSMTTGGNATGGSVSVTGGSTHTPTPTKPNETELLAFPTAEGFGKKTVGGRGGFVYEVINLNDSGPGSLREALGNPGPRTIVFRVSGNIELKSAITVLSHTTIAGQTAPGDGITLKNGQLAFKGTQIIMRYFRVRLGDQSGNTTDAIHGSGNSSQVILDHISASFSIDEALSFYTSDLVTLQWCLVAEPLNFSTHEKGDHGYGGLWGGTRNTHHHNLFAHCSSRTPRFKGDSDYRNNVAYNWVINSSYGGGPLNGLEFNMVANYYKPGPATPAGDLRHRIVEPYGGAWYVTDNFVFGNPAVTANNWDGGVQGTRGTRADKPFPFEPINQQTAEAAFDSVLAHAGCSFPKRDALDARVVQEVRDGTFKYGKKGIIDSPSDVGGWPELKSLPAPVDTDHDGMPDDWEKANGLNPADPKDRNQTYGPGYTMLEKYINSLVSY